VVVETERPATYREVFRVAEFRGLYAAYLLSMVGDMLAKVAVTFLVFQRTESPLLSAAAFGLSYLPWGVGGPFLAALADRWPRRRVLICCDIARAGGGGGGGGKGSTGQERRSIICERARSASALT
jgi:MFS family permease